MPRTKKTEATPKATRQTAHKATATPQPTSTREQLSSIIKSARDLMRKDAGLNGDLDRLPQLSWVLFLKCYDDLERAHDSRMGERANQLGVAAQPLAREVRGGRREQHELQRELGTGLAIARLVDDRALATTELARDLVAIRDHGSGR